MSGQHRDPGRFDRFGERPLGPWPHVHDGRHLDLRGREIERGPPRAVVVGEHHRAPPRRDRIAVHVRGRRAREHDPRPVVVLEDERALGRTRREHHPARPDPPHPLAGPAAPVRGKVVGAPFEGRDETVLVEAEGGGPVENGHLRLVRERRRAVRDPREGGLAPELAAGPEEAPPELRLVVGEDHPRPRPRRREGGGEPGRPSPDHEHVAEDVALVVAVRVRSVRGAPVAGHAADGPLVPVPPGARPHEGLVVEPGRQHRAEPLQSARGIETKRGPAVHLLRLESLDQLHQGSGGVGDRRSLDTRVPHGEDPVRLLRPAPDEAARTVVLDAPRDHPHSVREQGRREGVAAVPLEAQPVEAEVHAAATVDAAAADEPEWLGNGHSTR